MFYRRKRRERRGFAQELAPHSGYLVDRNEAVGFPLVIGEGADHSTRGRVRSPALAGGEELSDERANGKDGKIWDSDLAVGHHSSFRFDWGLVELVLPMFGFDWGLMELVLPNSSFQVAVRLSGFYALNIFIV